MPLIIWNAFARPRVGTVYECLCGCVDVCSFMNLFSFFLFIFRRPLLERDHKDGLAPSYLSPGMGPFQHILRVHWCLPAWRPREWADFSQVCCCVSSLGDNSRVSQTPEASQLPNQLWKCKQTQTFPREHKVKKLKKYVGISVIQHNL